MDPKHPPTNLMTGVMCVEVASNASNLLMDIKPGYMLGAKPRQQAIGHVIGMVEVLVELLKDADPEVRKIAAQALGKR